MANTPKPANKPMKEYTMAKKPMKSSPMATKPSKPVEKGMALQKYSASKSKSVQSMGREAPYSAAAAKTSAAAKNKARAESKPVPLSGAKKPAKSYNDKLKQGATTIKGFAYGKKTQ